MSSMKIAVSPSELGIGSRSLRRRAKRLDLPLPVRPQIAIFSPE
jgi:hypothetical protein